MTQVANQHDLDADEVERVAREIEHYLTTRAGSTDTLKGIVHWWLMQQRVIETEKLVEKAILYLCKEDKVEKRQLPDGTELIFCNKTTATENMETNNG